MEILLLIFSAAATGAFFMTVPGPSMAAMLSYALSHPWRQTLMLMFGIRTGDAILLGIALLGMTALAENYSGWFRVLEMAGACYLLWIGYGLLVKNRIQKRNSKLDRGMAFMGGFMTGLGNPKSVLLYISFLPNVIDMSALTFFSGFVVWISMITSYVLMGFLMYGSASKTQHLLKNDDWRNYLQKIMGSIMIALALYALIARS